MAGVFPPPPRFIRGKCDIDGGGHGETGEFQDTIEQFLFLSESLQQNQGKGKKEGEVSKLI